ncbi:MAG: CBS domain-containing protein [Pyrobaculum sp.]|jgi:CBS domain-containing protein
MYCGDVAVRPVITITLDKTIEEAAALMTQHHIGLLVIVEKESEKTHWRSLRKRLNKSHSQQNPTD